MSKRGITQKSNDAERLTTKVEKNNSDADTQTMAILVNYLNQSTTRCIFFFLNYKSYFTQSHVAIASPQPRQIRGVSSVNIYRVNLQIIFLPKKLA